MIDTKTGKSEEERQGITSAFNELSNLACKFSLNAAENNDDSNGPCDTPSQSPIRPNYRKINKKEKDDNQN